MKRKSLFGLLACALLVLSMLGCGTSNNLQSIQLSTSNKAEVAMSAQTLPGISNTIQLYVWGNYSSGKVKLLDAKGGVTWSIKTDPVYNQDAFGFTMPAPCLGSPCAQGTGGASLSSDGLLTAVSPAACTWVDVAQVSAQNPTPTPSWAISGQYNVTASYAGFTTPPVAVALSDTGGNIQYPYNDPNNQNNLQGLCD